MPELTKAEQTAAEALAERHNAHSTTDRLSTAAFAGEARAVVEAVRPLIEAEVLDDMADRFETYRTLGGEQAWPFVAEIRMATASRRAAARQSGEGQH